MSAPESSVNLAHQHFVEHHEKLDRLLRAVLLRARAGDARDMDGPWHACEAGLRAHLIAEEEEIFPHYEQEAPDEVRALKREHAELRALLDAAGFGVELHTVRLMMLEELAARLREHAAREDAGLYRFLDRAPPEVRARANERLGTIAQHAEVA